MKSFSEQLSATSANLDRLHCLAANHPDLFAFGHLIDVTPVCSRVYIHARADRERDWKAFARKYSEALWQREPSASDCGCYDWSGTIDGVKISILQAERREESRSLFAKGEVEA